MLSTCTVGTAGTAIIKYCDMVLGFISNPSLITSATADLLRFVVCRLVKLTDHLPAYMASYSRRLEPSSILLSEPQILLLLP